MTFNICKNKKYYRYLTLFTFLVNIGGAGTSEAGGTQYNQSQGPRMADTAWCLANASPDSYGNKCSFGNFYSNGTLTCACGPADGTRLVVYTISDPQVYNQKQAAAQAAAAQAAAAQAAAAQAAAAKAAADKAAADKLAAQQAAAKAAAAKAAEDRFYGGPNVMCAKGVCRG